MRASRTKSRTKTARWTPPPTLAARLGARVALETRADGKLIACFDHHAVEVGTFGAGAMAAARKLRAGLPLAAFASEGRDVDKEIDLLVRRLARHGLLEYRLGRSPRGEDLVVIEPQLPDYWPQASQLGAADALVLSRFAYMRRRGDHMVLESPRAGALFRICDPKIATALAGLSTPRRLKELRRQDGFPGIELLALLVDCRILFKIDVAGGDGRRRAEGDDDLVLWDFHDLLFHARSTPGRHANPLGGLYPYAGVIAPLPAVRPRWPGQTIDLPPNKFSAAHAGAGAPLARLLRRRHSTRRFDDKRPITLAELSRFLDGAARVVSRRSDTLAIGDGAAKVTYAPRPYPSAGAGYELELYLAVDACEGLARGFYHYDAGAHALVAIGAPAPALQALLTQAQYAMGAAALPQILITLAARFGRMSWKYSANAYALILKDVGVVTQTLYLMATAMGLGGCAIGSPNIDLFAKITGIAFHVEGAVGQFAIGRPAKPQARRRAT